MADRVAEIPHTPAVSDEETEQLLRLCLAADPPEAAAAWQALPRWQEDLPAAVAGSRPILRRLLPLFGAAVVRQGLPIAPAGLALLQAARLWERRRWLEVRAITCTLLPGLADRRIDTLLIGGVAAAATAYPEAALRHCHDLDLLIASDRKAEACAVLVEQGLSPLPGRSHHPGHSLEFRHPGGLPVWLHLSPLPPGPVVLPGDALRARASALPFVEGLPSPVPHPLHLAVHLAGRHANGSCRNPVRWAPDLAFLLRCPCLGPSPRQRLLRAASGPGLTETAQGMVAFLEERLALRIF